ncbi:hypothetical protein GEMRC1_007270 [Eukaryota sp. GEM-RC1]
MENQQDLRLQTFRFLAKSIELRCNKSIERCALRFEIGGDYIEHDLRHEGRGVESEGTHGPFVTSSVLSSLSSGSSHSYPYIMARKFSLSPENLVTQDLIITLQSRPLIRKWKRETIAHARVPISDIISGSGVLKLGLKKGEGSCCCLS